eukprot:scaffold4632_cov110-Isochrysis_galbana.AAC.3
MLSHKSSLLLLFCRGIGESEFTSQLAFALGTRHSHPGHARKGKGGRRASMGMGSHFERFERVSCVNMSEPVGYPWAGQRWRSMATKTGRPRHGHGQKEPKSGLTPAQLLCAHPAPAVSATRRRRG